MPTPPWLKPEDDDIDFGLKLDFDKPKSSVKSTKLSGRRNEDIWLAAPLDEVCIGNCQQDFVFY